MKLLARVFSTLLLGAIVLLAVAMGSMRLAIVNIDYFKPEIEYLIARDISPGVVFTGLSGAMDRFNPILRIENEGLRLLAKQAFHDVSFFLRSRHLASVRDGLDDSIVGSFQPSGAAL